MAGVARGRIKSSKIAALVEASLARGGRPEALASRAGVSVSTLYWVRRTGGVMSKGTAAKLAAALGCDAPELAP